MEQSQNPLSSKAIIAGLVVTIIGGIVVASIVGEGRFAPSDSTPSFPPITAPPPTTVSASPGQQVASRATVLQRYADLYGQEGWCYLWNTLVAEGGVSGECPQPRYGQQSEGGVEVDGFVVRKGADIIGFVLQADTEVKVNYLHCVSFDPTNPQVQYRATNARIIQVQPNGWIATDVYIRGPFTFYLWCDDVAWPNP